MFKKAPVGKGALNINEVIEEAISLIQTEVSSKSVHSTGIGRWSIFWFRVTGPDRSGHSQSGT